MKKLFRFLAPVSFFVAPLVGQTAEGVWQGTLHAGTSLRCELQISKDETGLKGNFYSLDQGGKAISASAVSLQDGMLRFKLLMLDASYEGKVSADGKTADGVWKQGSVSLPLVLEHVNADAAWPLPTIKKIDSMPVTADPSPEVATIKPSQPDKKGQMITIRGDHLVTVNTSLEYLIAFVYGIHPKQIAGGPDWMSKDKFDIEIKPDIPGTPNDVQYKSIMKKLILDRFQLKVHPNKKELSVYSLELNGAAPKFEKSTSDPKGPPALFFRQLGRMVVVNATMQEFIEVMQAVVLDRPVLDNTHLTGTYDFHLNWTPDESQFGGLHVPPAGDEAEFPNLFTAIKEQLGLKLDAKKMLTNTLVVDSVAKPSE